MNRKSKTKKKIAKGFSLIEVMIALVILAVGILGISILQAVLIKNSTNANQRTVAVAIAQKKIDDLKGFIHLTTAPAAAAVTWSAGLNAASLAYSHIATDEGGAPIGSTGLSAGDLTVGNYNYTLSWQVTDYRSAGLLTPVVSTPAADMKLVKVTVAWLDEVGESQHVSLSTVLDAYKPSLTAFSDADGNLDHLGPKITYTPLDAPDVVPVTLDVGDKKKESSKSVPDLSKKGDSRIVYFQTVTYTPNASDTEFTAIRKEEFLTAACNCKNGPSTHSIIKGAFEWDEDDLILRDVALAITVSPVITNTTVDNGGGEAQHGACLECCRDSADIAATTFKTCRMKRIDGIYRLYEPWKMIAFNLIPASYFNTATSTVHNSLPTMTSTIQASNISLYSDYVRSVVRNALVTLQGASTITPNSDFKNFAGVDLFVNTANTVDHTKFTSGDDYRELQVRAVYLDLPPTEIYGTEYNALGDAGLSEVPLDRVPFFENNFTQIAGWIPDIDFERSGANTGDTSFDANYTEHHDDMDSSACVQTDLPSSNRNYVTNEETFYFGGGITTDCLNASRGAFYPIIAATPVISVRMFTSNDGVIDRLVDTVGALSVDATINLTVE